MAEKVAEKNVLAIVGSLRKASVNRQLAEAAAEHAPAGVSVTIYEDWLICRTTTRTSTVRVLPPPQRPCVRPSRMPTRCCW